MNKSQFDLKWTENYGYDPNFDYLTSANYGDGQPNAVQSWTYDAAGNRTSDYTGTSWSYDNLNRMTVSPGATYTNDILGNRLTKGSATYGWDCLNRMVSYMNGSANETYGYRADGMRTFKSNSGSTTVYRYDGQMGMEDVDLAGSNTTVTDYGLGARGIDYISYSVNGGTPSVSFPVYDAHGNMVATLARNGGGTYQVSNQRAYGAWGEIRQGATTGDPKGRYCANLGHKQDDESGLTYMRARYYDGVSGRFVREDPRRAGTNWFAYANNCPNDIVDSSGKDAESVDFLIAGLIGGFIGLYGNNFLFDAILHTETGKDQVGVIVGALLGATHIFIGMPDQLFYWRSFIQQQIDLVSEQVTVFAERSEAGPAILAVCGYDGLLVAALIFADEGA